MSMSISHKVKFFRYAAFSVVGLLISTVVFHVNHSLMNIPVFYSNLIGDLIAIGFVFICSWIIIFDHSKQRLGMKFVLNLLAKMLVIYLLSITLSVISNCFNNSSLLQGFSASRRDLLLTLVKFLLAPVSLLTNYLITFILIEKLFLKG